jgi:ABC-type multidrug transport system fused ATPase/permease subunit
MFIVIAHRLDTIRNADQIIVVEEARVVESGDWATLIVSDGRLARMVAT